MRRQVAHAGARAQVVAIAGVQLEPRQTAVDFVGEINDGEQAQQLASYVRANVALVKLAFATRRGRVVLAADVVEMNLSNRGIAMHGARIIASFLPRWYVCMTHGSSLRVSIPK